MLRGQLQKLVLAEFVMQHYSLSSSAFGNQDSNLVRNLAQKAMK